MPNVAYDRYYRYADLTSILESYSAEFPDLVQTESIGKSHEGRDIWLATITDLGTGPAIEKPAFWVDGNIHASELSASTAALKLIEKLVQDQRELLKTHAFYVVPRLNPDGAEWATEDPPRIVRSGTRAYPYDEEDPYGIERKDMDGDGRMLWMRLQDNNGPWIVSDLNPRLLRKRNPGEAGGASCYRLLPEGIFHNWDGLTLQDRKVKEGLDFNRNFPSAWRLEGEQHGAGPFPTSEPEIHAAVNAICRRPNICGAVCFHTFSGVHLRPPSRYADDELPAEDLWNFKAIGDKGFEMTGYPAISNYHEFRYHPKEVITGVFDDWMYEHRGVYAWTTEIWSPQRQAGITDYKYIDWFREHPHEHDVKMLEWSDSALDGKGYEDWREFDHPQLGKVEIGGWDREYAFRNPPHQFLEKEVSPLADWVIWQAGLAPRLSISKLVSDGGRVRVVVQNVGWLPTYVTKTAVTKKMCRGVVAEISRIDGSPPDWLLGGKLRSEGPQLEGWSSIGAAASMSWGSLGNNDQTIFEWVLAPGEYELTFKHDRAGVVRTTVSIQ
ncbi:MAG: carboxypeptidase [Chlorobia bacterium]|nr:carboxypeptidase [Fimbriimonadaceae bacterium]